MKKRILIKYIAGIFFVTSLWSCKMFKVPLRSVNENIPAAFNKKADTTNTSKVKWSEFFTDKNLTALIDTALKNNQELNITLQEIQTALYEVKAKKGEYLPFVNVGAGAGLDKVGRYTRNGVLEENLDAQPGKKFSVPLGDYAVGATFSWELDVWKKLRNSKKAAFSRYLAGVEGKNFLVTNLVAEIANSYYELLALDNRLEIIRKNIEIQENALAIVKQQKESARVSQLAVNRFEALVLNTKNLQYEILQKIVETENRLNFLTGRYPGPITRDDASFTKTVFDNISEGVPAQLVENRPDIRMAIRELEATKLDIKVAKAAFYPSLKITASAGFNAFNPSLWFNPLSICYSLLGDLAAPLVNRNAIVANYKSSRAKQVQAALKYDQTMLNAFLEVRNQLAAMENYTNSYNTKNSEVEILTKSISIADNLFTSARADYMEVLLTQREALESKIELIEIKNQQLKAEINLYKALGGGWR